MNETRYPLCWPANWKRTQGRTRAQFGSTREVPIGSPNFGKQRLSIAMAIDRIADEMQRMGINEDDVIISTNVQLNLSGIPRSDRSEPVDPGAAIYWKRKGKSQCMAIDRYDRVADNLAAIAATLDALRAIERHGGGSILERAFIGFAQLPAAIVTQRPWREVLGFLRTPAVDEEMVQQAYRARCSNNHPDTGGSHDQMVELNAARDAALAELKG